MDKRFYKRIPLHAKGVVFVNNNEINIQIDNVCEDGIGLYADEEGVKLSNIVIGDSFDVIFIDEDDNKFIEKNKVVSGRAEIVRMEKKDNQYYMGCKIIGDVEYSNYVSRKKAERCLRETLSFFNLLHKGK